MNGMNRKAAVVNDGENSNFDRWAMTLVTYRGILRNLALIMYNLKLIVGKLLYYNLWRVRQWTATGSLISQSRHESFKCWKTKVGRGENNWIEMEKKRNNWERLNLRNLKKLILMFRKEENQVELFLTEIYIFTSF